MTLQTEGPAAVAVGSALVDAPLNGPDGDTWLVQQAQGTFTLIGFGDVSLPAIEGVRRIGVDHSSSDYPCFHGSGGHAVARYGAGTTYLIRPDGHICACFDSPDTAAITKALTRAKGQML